jgi:4-hydroxybenzoate polyprenyltransferase
MTTGVLAVASIGRTVSALVEAMRPRQWVKNLFVFAGLIFAGVDDDPQRWFEAAAAFGIFCLLSSGAYLFNDARDAESDRLHPVKKLRPIARGALSPELARIGAVLLLVSGIAAASALGHNVLEYAVGFAMLQFAYTLALKRVVLVDVLAIASLFVVRAAAGANAVHVLISPWLLACTALLAVFLGLAKRRSEFVIARRGHAPGREALRGYTLDGLDGLLSTALVGTLVTYAAYAIFFSPHAQWMALTIPFVIAGLARYLQLVRRDELGEQPETVLLTDRLLLVSVALWVLAAAAVVAYR